MKKNFLGDLSPSQFLKTYWQKKPLLIRNAFPGFGDLLTKEKLITLATQEEVQSRLVQYQHKQWSLSHGPMKKRDLATLKNPWALLVQDVNHHIPEAQKFLNQFNFIPHARLDDLMVSFAPDGGGVGPHFDSYDVFLLQGSGQRVWQISSQKDQRLIEDAPLRILKKFKPEQEWLLNPGDMLYLPPHYAHQGVAVGDCMTYSIGFRAPDFHTLTNEFLMYLQDHIQIDGIYADPDLSLTKNPAKISDAMISKVTHVLEKIKFNKKTISDFLGQYLSEPKSHVFFDPPTLPISKNKFLKSIAKSGVKLDLKSQLLFTDEMIFMNGEGLAFKSLSKEFLKKLADEKEALFNPKINLKTQELLYEWYLNGFIKIL